MVDVIGWIHQLYYKAPSVLQVTTLLRMHYIITTYYATLTAKISHNFNFLHEVLKATYVFQYKVGTVYRNHTS